jgi:hypothetical protein
MEEACGWLAWLKPDDARLVWARAEGVRWRAICRRLGVSRQTAWRRWVAALVAISTRLRRESLRQNGSKAPSTAA